MMAWGWKAYLKIRAKVAGTYWMRTTRMPMAPTRKMTAMTGTTFSVTAARRFTPEFCRRAAELVLETDYKIKTSYDDPERLLELLLLQLAQEGRNG